MGGSTDDYDVHYFMPQPDSSKFSHLRLDEPGRYIDWPLSLEATAPETTTPMEPIATLPSQLHPPLVPTTIFLLSLVRS